LSVEKANTEILTLRIRMTNDGKSRFLRWAAERQATVKEIPALRLGMTSEGKADPPLRCEMMSGQSHLGRTEAG
jgi:hypothetical protein